jgi:beta-galactosidase
VGLQPGQGGPSGALSAVVWADEIELTTARPVSTYASGWLSGLPAITVNEYGKGKVVYVGAVLRGEHLKAFTAWLVRLCEVEPVLRTPPGVRAHERRSDDSRLVFLLNYTNDRQVVQLDGDWQDVLEGQTLREAQLAPAGVAILQKAIQK